MTANLRKLGGAAALTLAVIAVFSHRAGAEPDPASTDAPAPLPSGAPPEPAANPARDAAIRKLVAEVQGWGGSVGLAVVDIATGNPIAMVNEHAPLNPASNAKLATAAAALRLLGPDHRFLTGLYGHASGEKVDTLVLRGDGDPSFATRDLWAMATELHAMGLRRVRSLLVDQSAFDDDYTPPAFAQQPNEWAPFRAPVAPVSLDGNTVLFEIRPAGFGVDALVDAEPPGFVDLVGSARTTGSKAPEKLTVDLEAVAGGRLKAHVDGTVPMGGRLIRLARRVDDPRLLAGYALRALLSQAGVEVSGTVGLGGGAQKKLLVTHRSARLGEMASALGKDSDNFYAEMLFKALGVTEGGSAASAEAGAEAVTGYLHEAGAFEPGVVVTNGSGLFDANRTTPWATVALLRAAYRDPRIGPDFTAQLAIGGVDGTTRSRFKEWANERAVRAKTGTLEATAALSGYVLPPPGGSPIAFSVLINGIAGKVGAARPLIDAVVTACADEVWKGAR